MIESLLTAVAYAVENIRSNFFHTLLSVIGITIGVAALIIILSMIDGLEEYAEDQISTTTSVKVVEVSSVTRQTIDGISIKKEDPTILTSSIHQELISDIDVPFTTYRVSEIAKSIGFENKNIGALIYYSDIGYSKKYELAYGNHLFDNEHKLKNEPIAVIDSVASNRITSNSLDSTDVIGKEISINGESFKIIGVVKGYSQNPEILIPINYLTEQQLVENPPFIAIEANDVINVPKVKNAVQKWLEDSPFTRDDIRIFSQDSRINQATQGFMLFRIIMGLIVGISVVVGGIGVMNVLLISVTQRTKEIGLRKAVGSRKKDIYIQFLSESMVVTLFGTFVGIVIGILLSLAVAPIVHAIIEIPFSPTFSLLTITAITVLSLLIGILFGTFPAYKASQLSPIDALRRE